jgi:hypothetical protein
MGNQPRLVSGVLCTTSNLDSSIQHSLQLQLMRLGWITMFTTRVKSRLEPVCIDSMCAGFFCDSLMNGMEAKTFDAPVVRLLRNISQGLDVLRLLLLF